MKKKPILLLIAASILGLSGFIALRQNSGRGQRFLLNKNFLDPHFRVLAQSFDDPNPNWPMLAGNLKRWGSTSYQTGSNFELKWISDFWSKSTDFWGNSYRNTLNTKNVSITSKTMIFQGIQPLIVNDRTCFGTVKNEFYCLDLSDGHKIWSVQLSEGGAILETAAYYNGKFFIPSTDGRLYCYDFDGNFQWKSVKSAGGFRSSPAPLENKVYIGAVNGVFYAFNISDGSTSWEQDLNAPILSSCAIDVSRNLLIQGSEDMYVRALDLNNNGNVIWQSSKLHGVSQQMFYPVIYNDVVFVTTMPGNSSLALPGGDALLASTAGVDMDSYCSNPEFCTVKYYDSPPGFNLNAPFSSSGFQAEKQAVKNWLENRYPEFKVFYALDITNGQEKYTVPIVYGNGCGNPQEPPVITQDGSQIFTRTRSYYSSMDSTYARLFDSFAVLNPQTGETTLVNSSGGRPMTIGDETSVFSLSGNRLFNYNHGDTVDSITTDGYSFKRVLKDRDYPWWLGIYGRNSGCDNHELDGCRNIDYPFLHSNHARFNAGGHGGHSVGVSIGQGYLVWVGNGVIGAVQSQ